MQAMSQEVEEFSVDVKSVEAHYEGRYTVTLPSTIIPLSPAPAEYTEVTTRYMIKAVSGSDGVYITHGIDTRVTEHEAGTEASHYRYPDGTQYIPGPGMYLQGRRLGEWSVSFDPPLGPLKPLQVDKTPRRMIMRERRRG